MHFINTYQSSNLWFDIPNLISIDRYRETLSYPLLVKYSLYLIYPGSIVSGIILSYYELNILKKISVFMPFAVCIILEFWGSRTSIIIGFILFLKSSFLFIIINFKAQIHSYKIISIFFVFILLFLFFVFFNGKKKDLIQLILIFT